MQFYSSSSHLQNDLNHSQASIDESFISQPPLIDLNEYPQDMSPSQYNQEHVQPPENIAIGTKKKNLNNNKKVAVMKMLSENIRDGKLPKGAINKVAEHFSLCRKTVSRIWRDTKNYCASGNLEDLSSKMVKNVGRKRVEVDVETMKAIPFRRRTNIRSLSNALGLAKSTVHRRIKEKKIRPHSNAMKPSLSDENKKARLEFCLSMVNEGTTLRSKNFFIDMYDRIHIDEKWFFLSNTTQKIYLHPDEIEPSRTCKSKRFIEKVMFLTAVARPRFGATNNLDFDGKIGTWQTCMVELISPVKNAFDTFAKEKLNNVFLTLQTCMVEILKKNGGNNYKIPHMSKDRLVRTNQLPICIECDSQTLEHAKIALRQME